MTEPGFEFDEMAWLRDRDPARTGAAPVRPTEAELQELLARVVATPRRRRPSRRTVAALVVAASVVAGSTAAAVVLLRQSPDEVTVVCAATAEPGGSQVVLAPSGDPVAACAEAWSDPALTDVFGNQPLPTLVACVDDGQVVVLPQHDGGDVCQARGLPHADPPSADLTRARAVLEVVQLQLLGTCTSPDAAAQLARRELDRAELGRWSVVVDRPITAGAACASLALDVPRAELHIVPVPPRSPR